MPSVPPRSSMLLEGGEYDVFRRDALRIELDRIEPRTDIVLDLATTDFIDCSCIGVLIARLRSWRERRSGYGWIRTRLV